MLIALVRLPIGKKSGTAILTLRNKFVRFVPAQKNNIQTMNYPVISGQGYQNQKREVVQLCVTGDSHCFGKASESRSIWLVLTLGFEMVWNNLSLATPGNDLLRTTTFPRRLDGIWFDAAPVRVVDCCKTMRYPAHRTKIYNKIIQKIRNRLGWGWCFFVELLKEVDDDCICSRSRHGKDAHASIARHSESRSPLHHFGKLIRALL
jgi:hypothetical protein